MVARRLPRSLERELEAWVVEGILSPEQAGRIRARYKPTPGGGFVGALFAFGAVLIGLGIILAIAANWQGLAGGAKLVVVVAFVAAFNVFGYHYRYGRGERRALGDALLVMGGFAYGAGIWLVAQVFHFPLGAPVAMAAWALGVLLAAWALSSLSLLVLSSILVTTWLFSIEEGAFLGGYATTWVLAAFVPVAWVVMRLARRHSSVPALVFMLMGWGFWLGSLMDKAGAEGISTPVALALFGLLLMVARDLLATSTAQRLAVVVLGTLFLFFSDLPLTFKGWFRSEMYYLTNYPIPLVVLMAGITYLAVRAAIGAFRRPESRVLVGLVAAHGMLPLINNSYKFALFSVAGILLSASLLGLAYIAHQRREAGPFRLALWLLGFYLAIRYFSTYSNILPQALVFVLGGILLVVGGIFLERSVRRLFAQGGEG